MKTKKLPACLICLAAGVCLLSGCALPGRSGGTPVADRTDPRVWKTEHLKPDHLALAENLVREGFYHVALVQLDPPEKAQLPKAYRVRVYDLSGVCARETGDFKGAFTWLDKALALDSRNASVHNNGGILHAMAGDGENAVKFLERASALDPGRSDILNNLGWAYMEQKAYFQAESCFRKGLALNPDDPTIINNLSLCLGLQGRDAQAYDLLIRHHSPDQAGKNMEAIRAMRVESGSLTGRAGQAFEIQTRNSRDPDRGNAVDGLSGDAAHSIYSDKYLPAMKKD